ncbi:ribosomal maturation YjgA family protein [Carboxylicivirga linearis]|uniref:DUF2809 domain-containing protein n=1 Tax=Carboxylicivirga linearis TaxID=1628157 RepID=A0ABS5JSB4_9BACT|nr:DUF2809 domain-containing protein [Carboxylicivirga linearis]MBS2097791.1 DUF2809 domain-containing protein [Carboxylicivirga linearis]
MNLSLQARKTDFWGTLLLIILGLFVRSEYISVPEILEPYIGDVIWGAMVFFFFGIILAKTPLLLRMLFAISFSFLIEFSQLLKYDWIEFLRSYKIIALVIGYDYSTSDLICYTIGIGIAYFIRKKIKNRN